MTTTAPDTRIELTLPPDLDTPAAARTAARETLARWAAAQEPIDIDSVLLVLTELVTNAVLHGGGQDRGTDRTVPVTIVMDLRPEHLALAVTDGHHLGGHPIARRPRTRDEHGRGLAIVTALSSAYGYSSGPGYTTAWAHLPLTA
jgi:anti-sigma regulatory factor (Ser/Thr protein kinase)